ncbi:MAG: hypothetical protein IKS83_04945 [Victivallales bacterium]|nr:hypothetical protein [Victivallales bacterium]
MKQDFLWEKIQIALLTVFLLSGCGRQANVPIQAIPKLTAQEHLDAAELLKKTTDDWPLAIWHYQQFLETAAEEGKGTAEVDRAKVQLEELRQSYVTLYSGISLGALEAENAALRRGNKTLADQLERLKADNAVLNSTLLKMQQASGR